MKRAGLRLIRPGNRDTARRRRGTHVLPHTECAAPPLGSDTADCAIIVAPEVESLTAKAKILPLPEAWLAKQDHFERLQRGRRSVFHRVFPDSAARCGSTGQPSCRLRVAPRLHPFLSVPFTNAEIRTTDTTMVAGLSFNGSSGSLVANGNQRELRPAETSRTPAMSHRGSSASCPATLASPLGIACSTGTRGLSYYTRSTAASSRSSRLRAMVS